MAWLGRQSTSGRRHSMGGAPQQNSIRDALRARGGAQIPRATTDVEDNEDIPVKGNLDWLGLNPFAPKAMGSLVERLKATGEGAMDRIKAGIGEDAVDRLKAGGAGAFDRIKAGAGAVLAGEFSTEDHPLSFSPPKRQAEDESASSSEANGRMSTSGRKSTSLRSALQARGGIGRTSVGSREAPEASDAVQEQVSQKLDEVADEQKADEQIQEFGDQPSLQKALSSPLPAVREDEEEDSPQHDAEEPLREEVETEEEDAAKEPETKPSEDLTEEHDECMHEEDSQHREHGDEEVSASPEQAEADTETAETVREAAVLGEDASSAAVGGLETASHDRRPSDESVHVVAPETTKTTTTANRCALESAAKSPAQSSFASKLALDNASRLPVPPSYVSKNLDEHAVVVQRQAPSAEPEKPSGPPLLAPAPPRRRPDRESQDVGKLKDLQQFWGSKKSKGFAGPELGSSRLSKNEAQATLQRLQAAGGDFDEVRRLRKLIQELDQ